MGVEAGPPAPWGSGRLGKALLVLMGGGQAVPWPLCPARPKPAPVLPGGTGGLGAAPGSDDFGVFPLAQQPVGPHLPLALGVEGGGQTPPRTPARGKGGV